MWQQHVQERTHIVCCVFHSCLSVLCLTKCGAQSGSAPLLVASLSGVLASCGACTHPSTQCALSVAPMSVWVCCAACTGYGVLCTAACCCAGTPWILTVAVVLAFHVTYSLVSGNPAVSTRRVESSGYCCRFLKFRTTCRDGHRSGECVRPQVVAIERKMPFVR